MAVAAGGSVPLRITLSVAGVSEQVQVSVESPVVDPKRDNVSTTITNEELQNIPSARDPWVVLQTVPGIIVDRVNVGGSESGQQSNYVAKGADTGDNTWNLDGIPITDMNALGSTPTYYDFDMFQEMNVSTGGADVQASTPGVQLNFVLKSGTNNFHGTGRVFYENKDLQGTNLPERPRGHARRRQRQGQPARSVCGLRRRGRRADSEEQMVGMGIAGAHQRHDPDAPGHSRQDDADRRERQDQRAVLAEVARQLHLLQRQQAEGRPRRRPVQSAGDDVHPERPVEALQG